MDVVVHADGRRILAGAFGNFLIPLMIGADDMAFPTLNMLSYWFMWPAFICIGVSFLWPPYGAGGGWTSYPPPKDDSYYFLPPAVRWAAGKSFSNPLWPMGSPTLHPHLDDRFIHHGPFFPWLVKVLLWRPTGPGALLIVHLGNAVNV